MGLIREPKNVDFYVIDAPWTTAEKKELSAYIKQRKARKRRSKTSAKPANQK